MTIKGLGPITTLVGVAVVATLAGCTSTPPPDPVAPVAPPAVTNTAPAPAVTNTAPAPDSAGKEPVLNPGWKEWRPKEPVRDRKSFTEEEKLALRATNLKEQAEQLNLAEPPEVPLERWIRSDEFGAVSEKCYAEYGFDVKGTFDGLGLKVVTRPAEDQASLFDLTTYTCSARFSVDPEYRQPITEDQMRVRYEYELDFLIPCLQDLGYTTPQPPSLETYVSTFWTENWSAWNALEEADAILEAACPPTPPTGAWIGE
ncbi:MAG: hypothetical protein QM713_13480 [Arachnia sp.]